MTDLKEIGHNINLKGIVVHQINKSAGTTLCNLKIANKELKVSKKEVVFIANINKAYYKKSNPIYGVFGDDDPTYKNELFKYHSNQIEFLDFTVKSVEHYKKIISRSAPATGGLVIFAHFSNSETNCEYVMVLTTNNKDGYAIDEENLTITDIRNLDLSKIDVACQINLTKWINIENKTDKDNKTYLSFVKGNKEVSNYFMDFIDCKDKTNNIESTKRLIRAIDSFCSEKGYDRDGVIKKKNDIYDYCNDCLKNKKEISLAAISALLNNEQPEEFAEFASSEENGVSATISGDKAQLRRIKYLYYKDSNITVGFDNELLNKTVFYEPKKKQLTFKNLPPELIEQIEK